MPSRFRTSFCAQNIWTFHLLPMTESLSMRLWHSNGHAILEIADAESAFDTMRCDDIIEIMYHTHWIMRWNVSELKVKIHIDWMLRVECAYGILNWFFSPEIRSLWFFRCASQITRFQCLLIHMLLNVSKSKTSLKTIRLKLSHTENALSTRSDIFIERYRVK